MRQPTLPGIVQRRFIHCATHHGEPVAALVARIGAPPGDLCRLIAGQQIDALPLATFERIARWLRMPPHFSTRIWLPWLLLCSRMPSMNWLR